MTPSSRPRWTIVCAICRADPADDAVGAHQPRRRNGLDQVLRHQRIDGRHAGDVDDRDLGAGLDDLLEQALHHDLRARAVERADQRQSQDAVPQLDDRRREFEQLLLLARDDLLAAALVHLGRVETELVEQGRGGPDLPDPAAIPPSSVAISANSGSLSEKTKVAVSDGVKPSEARSADSSSSTLRASAQPGPEISSRSPLSTPRRKAARKRRDCSPSSRVADRAAAEPRHAALQPQPFVEQTIAAPLDQPGNQVLRRVFHLCSVSSACPVLPACPALRRLGPAPQLSRPSTCPCNPDNREDNFRNPLAGQPTPIRSLT